MNTIAALKEVYGYSTPIFLKDLHIRGKSKSAIRKELSRAAEKGEIIRKAQGIYCFKVEDEFLDSVTFEQIIERKFIKDDWGSPGLDFDIYGYYTGQTFLNQIGISQQVPAIVEIVTNRTSCKRSFKIKNRSVVLRKGKIEINRFNYKALQFFDIFYSLSEKEIDENKQLLFKYISQNLSKHHFEQYIGYYPKRFIKLIVEKGLINAFR